MKLACSGRETTHPKAAIGYLRAWDKYRPAAGDHGLTWMNGVRRGQGMTSLRLRWYFASCALLGSPATLLAQALELSTTCPAATAVPVALKGGPLKVVYDEFLDSTRVETKKWSGGGIGTSLELQLWMVGPGRSISALEPVLFRVVFGDLSGGRPAQTGQARFNTTSVLPLLAQSVGGTARILLAQPQYASRVTPPGVLSTAALEETMIYTVPDSDLLTLASASSVRMRIAEFEGNMPGPILEGARSLARARLCLRANGDQ